MGGSSLQQRTEAHYDAYPFEFMTPEDEASIVALQPRPFLRFIDEFALPQMRVGEFGCGPGRGTMYLVQKFGDVTALDLSRNSLMLARSRAPRARYVQASNLSLPFADASFDIVVSDGVIHHTPNPYRAFSENVRVLKPGGAFYLGVYNRQRYYYYLYTYLGRPLRWLERSWPGRILVYATVFPLYYLAHLVKSRGKRTLRGARNFFYDYFMTPAASFHSREEVIGWGRRNGLALLAYDASLGNVHVFMFRRAADSEGAPAGASA
ncbi:MAG TPA: class I SAM-dependent methyltransferase [Pseudolabrys sp.]|nr:class I SAM-dependent methyltransferase [Pseudolabrys sp.]